MYACLNAHLNIIEYLLKKEDLNINVDEKDEDNKTALMYVSEKGYLNIAKCLVKKGNANVNANVNEKDKNNQTSLGYALKNHHLRVAKYLIAKGAVI